MRLVRILLSARCRAANQAVATGLQTSQWDHCKVSREHVWAPLGGHLGRSEASLTPPPSYYIMTMELDCNTYPEGVGDPTGCVLARKS